MKGHKLSSLTSDEITEEFVSQASLLSLILFIFLYDCIADVV